MIGYSYYGKEYLTRRAYGSVAKIDTLEVGLYDHITDQLSDSDDVNAIDSEPDTGNYSRLTYSLTGDMVDITTNSNGDWVLSFSEKEFDLNETNGVCDGWFVVGEFMASTDDAAQPHLLGTSALRDQDGNSRDRDLSMLLSLSFSGTLTQTG